MPKEKIIIEIPNEKDPNPQKKYKGEVEDIPFEEVGDEKVVDEKETVLEGEEAPIELVQLKKIVLADAKSTLVVKLPKGWKRTHKDEVEKMFADILGENATNEKIISDTIEVGKSFDLDWPGVTNEKTKMYATSERITSIEQAKGEDGYFIVKNKNGATFLIKGEVSKIEVLEDPKKGKKSEKPEIEEAEIAPKVEEKPEKSVRKKIVIEEEFHGFKKDEMVYFVFGKLERKGKVVGFEKGGLLIEVEGEAETYLIHPDKVSRIPKTKEEVEGILVEKIKEITNAHQSEDPFGYFLLSKISPKNLRVMFGDKFETLSYELVKAYLARKELVPKQVTSEMEEICFDFYTNGFYRQFVNPHEVIKNNEADFEDKKAKFRIYYPDGTLYQDPKNGEVEFNYTDSTGIIEIESKKYEEEQKQIFEKNDTTVEIPETSTEKGILTTAEFQDILGPLIGVKKQSIKKFEIINDKLNIKVTFADDLGTYEIVVKIENVGTGINLSVESIKPSSKASKIIENSLNPNLAKFDIMKVSQYFLKKEGKLVQKIKVEDSKLIVEFVKPTETKKVPKIADLNPGDENFQILTEEEKLEWDERLEEAAKLIVLSQHGSATMLQRRLQIPLNRAKKIIDQLEALGIIGPKQIGTKPREVLISDEETLGKILANKKVTTPVETPQNQKPLAEKNDAGLEKSEEIKKLKLDIETTQGEIETQKEKLKKFEEVLGKEEIKKILRDIIVEILDSKSGDELEATLSNKPIELSFNSLNNSFKIEVFFEATFGTNKLSIEMFYNVFYGYVDFHQSLDDRASFFRRKAVGKLAGLVIPKLSEKFKEHIEDKYKNGIDSINIKAKTINEGELVLELSDYSGEKEPAQKEISILEEKLANQKSALEKKLNGDLEQEGIDTLGQINTEEGSKEKLKKQVETMLDQVAKNNAEIEAILARKKQREILLKKLKNGESYEFGEITQGIIYQLELTDEQKKKIEEEAGKLGLDVKNNLKYILQTVGVTLLKQELEQCEKTGDYSIIKERFDKHEEIIAAYRKNPKIAGKFSFLAELGLARYWLRDNRPIEDIENLTMGDVKKYLEVKDGYNAFNAEYNFISNERLRGKHYHINGWNFDAAFRNQIPKDAFEELIMGDESKAKKWMDENGYTKILEELVEILTKELRKKETKTSNVCYCSYVVGLAISDKLPLELLKKMTPKDIAEIDTHKKFQAWVEKNK